MTATRQRKPRVDTLWQDDYLYQAYAMAAKGVAQEDIAARLGVSLSTWYQWKRNRPALARAVAAGHQACTHLANPTTAKQRAKLPDYLLGRLSPELQAVWAKLHKVWREPDGHIQVEEALDGQPVAGRQALFLYALAHNAYSVSRAMAITNTSQAVFAGWCEQPEFQAMWQEIEFHKKNYLEDSLLRLVGEGNAQAIIHANKTYNRDRGYGDKLEISGTVQHNHAHLDITKLGLPDAVVEQVVQALLAKAGEDGLPATVDGKLF